eukprot:3344901-Rhodomonas_salina.1
MAAGTALPYHPTLSPYTITLLDLQRPYAISLRCIANLPTLYPYDAQTSCITPLVLRERMGVANAGTERAYGGCKRRY